MYQSALRTRASIQLMVLVFVDPLCCLGWAHWPLIVFSFLVLCLSLCSDTNRPAASQRVIRSHRQRVTIRSAFVGVLSVARPPIPSKRGAAATVHLEASPILYGSADSRRVIRSHRQRVTFRAALGGVLIVARPSNPDAGGGGYGPP